MDYRKWREGYTIIFFFFLLVNFSYFCVRKYLTTVYMQFAAKNKKKLNDVSLSAFKLKKKKKKTFWG